jgi:hypothetical protein
MGWNSCAGAQKETGNWRVGIAGRSRSPCRDRARRESAYYAAVSGRRVKPRIERLAARSFAHPLVVGPAKRRNINGRIKRVGIASQVVLLDGKYLISALDLKPFFTNASHYRSLSSLPILSIRIFFKSGE